MMGSSPVQGGDVTLLPAVRVFEIGYAHPLDFPGVGLKRRN